MVFYRLPFAVLASSSLSSCLQSLHATVCAQEFFSKAMCFIFFSYYYFCYYYIMLLYYDYIIILCCYCIIILLLFIPITEEKKKSPNSSHTKYIILFREGHFPEGLMGWLRCQTANTGFFNAFKSGGHRCGTTSFTNWQENKHQDSRRSKRMLHAGTAQACVLELLCRCVTNQNCLELSPLFRLQPCKERREIMASN